MGTGPNTAVSIFYSYAHEDKKLLEALENHLGLLKRQGLIEIWYDREISAGRERKREIENHLNSAHIILLLVSPYFLASEYCYGSEMQQAMERHETGEARVIPILLRPVDWHHAPFGKLECLPTDARPVTRWRDRDEAFLDIAQGIRRSAEEIRANSPTRRQVLQIRGSERASNNREATPFYRSIRTGMERKTIIVLNNPTEQQELKAIEEQAQVLNMTFTADKGFIGLCGEHWGESSFSNTPRGRLAALETLAKLACNIIVRLSDSCIVIINPSAYQTFQALLDTLYLDYLADQYKPYSYGRDWILAQYDDFPLVNVQRLASSWDWLLHPGESRIAQGFLGSPQACGLEGGTYWQLLNFIPESVFGIATNSSLVASCFTDRDRQKELWQLLQIIKRARRSNMAEGSIIRIKPQDSRGRIVSMRVESVSPENVDVNAYKFPIICASSENELILSKNTAFIITISYGG